MVKRPAFTMLELVWVIVILGIISTIGADIISSMYQNYLRARTIERLQSQTEITLEQIAKRLEYRIKDSIIARNSATNDLLALSDSSVTNDFDVIEWIGYSNETFRGLSTPLWTGLVDLENPNTSRSAGTIVSPGSDFEKAANYMEALTNKKVDMTSGKEAAIIFKRPSNIEDFGWDKTANSYGTNALPVTFVPSNPDRLSINLPTSALPSTIYEHYYLAHSAYALVPEGDMSDFNLTLRYNYQPWQGDFYDNNASSSLLATNVSLFRVRQDANLIRIKLCLHDDNKTGTNDRIVACKEKVVF